jgi:hypothetical protein
MESLSSMSFILGWNIPLALFGLGSHDTEKLGVSLNLTVESKPGGISNSMGGFRIYDTGFGIVATSG